MIQLLLPKKILKYKDASNLNALKVKKPLQVVLRGDKEWKESLTAVKGSGYLILDFGKEMHGGIRIITGKCSNSVSIRLRFGESLSEACSDIGVKGATNDHSPRDFNAVLPCYADIKLGQTGFRFVRIDFLDDGEFCIQNVFCENNILNKKAIYRYDGKDKHVKKIFDTAKRTVDLCASSGYVWDGIKRDRLVWVGDMHPEMLALATLYGRVEEVERSLEFVREQTPASLWMNGIATYSMWWAIIVADYYFITGCEDFTKRQIGYLQQLVGRFNETVNENGHIDHNWYFVDWPTCGSPDEEAGVRAINILAINKIIALFEKFGINTDLAKNVLKKLNVKEITVKKMKQVVGLKYLAEGEISDQEYALITEGGAKGLSTFMSYYILSAIASRDKELALDIMKEYYGAMLSIGATTFFEDFDMNWLENSSRIDKLPKKNQLDIHGDFGKHCYEGFRHSLCHGWSSGVIRFIYETQK